MKTVEFIWDGKPLYLMLNGTALFDILDRYGSRAEILELIEGMTRSPISIPAGF